MQPTTIKTFSTPKFQTLIPQTQRPLNRTNLNQQHQAVPTAAGTVQQKKTIVRGQLSRLPFHHVNRKATHGLSNPVVTSAAWTTPKAYKSSSQTWTIQWTFSYAKPIPLYVTNATTICILSLPHLISSFHSQACDKVQNTFEYASRLCSRYQRKVRGLSGEGMQIAPSNVDPDRSCKVACQDEFLQHRFYLVNGENGYFPFGTKCSRDNNDNRFCVNGKCLEFDENDVPLVESHVSLALYRSRRSTNDQPLAVDSAMNDTKARLRRSYLYFEPINITERISPELLHSIIESLETRWFPRRCKTKSNLQFNCKSNEYLFIAFRSRHIYWLRRSGPNESNPYSNRWFQRQSLIKFIDLSKMVFIYTIYY